MNQKTLDWRHDVAKRRGVNHRIMRDEQFSLCGEVMRDDRLAYVGAWDDGEPCTCDTCNSVWSNRRDAFFRNGGLES